jgi:putative flippase GtrA
MLVGAYNAIFGLTVFAILQTTLHRRLHYLVILPIAHLLAVSNAFMGHRLWTYRVEGHLWEDYLRFNASYLGLLLLGMVAMPLLVEGVGLHPITANAINLGSSTLISFFVHKYLSFRRPKRPPG